MARRDGRFDRVAGMARYFFDRPVQQKGLDDGGTHLTTAHVDRPHRGHPGSAAGDDASCDALFPFKYMNGISDQEFSVLRFGTAVDRAASSDPSQGSTRIVRGEIGFLEAAASRPTTGVCSGRSQPAVQDGATASSRRGTLSIVIESNDHTSWVGVRSRQARIDLLGEYDGAGVTWRPSTRLPRSLASAGWCAGIFAASMSSASRAAGRTPRA